MSSKLKLYLEGGRFDKAGGFPLESLPALRAVGSLIESIARDLFFSENPDRERVPAGFKEAFTPALTRLAGGSADCHIGGWANVDPELSNYYDDAQSETFTLLQALAEEKVAFPSWCSGRTKKQIAKVLGAISDDERLTLSVEANGVAPDPVTLGVTQRDRANDAAKTGARSTEEAFSIAGRIYRIEKDPWAIGIKVREGGLRLRIPIADALQDRARREFDARGEHLVRVRGRAERDVETGARTFIFASTMHRIGGPPIGPRLSELSGLLDGWIDDDDDSKAPTKALCRWVERQLWHAIEDTGWDRPLLFATRAGGVDAVWRRESLTLKACFTSRPLEVRFRAVDLAKETASASGASRALASLLPWAERAPPHSFGGPAPRRGSPSLRRQSGG